MTQKKDWLKKPGSLRILLAWVIGGVFLLIFTGTAAALAVSARFQAIPALLRCITSFSLGAAAAAAVIFLSALIAGRFYCAAFCPLGLLQDLFSLLHRKRKKTAAKNLYILRYLTAGIVYGMLIGGTNYGFLLLDPYSNAGRILFPFTSGGAAALLVIVLLAVWKRRIFCNTLCPAGALLGGLSRYSLFRLKIGSACIQCGKCVKNCPAECIDIENKIIDNERCIRCMNCISMCPVESIRFSKAEKPGAPDDSRRRFLISGGVLIAGLAAGASFARSGLLSAARKLRILPPGAGDPERFASKCTACMLCASNCPQKIIVPTRGGTGAVELDLSRGSCSYDCSRCSSICPTGALKKLSLSKKRKWKIAEAKFDPRSCIVFQEGEKCGKCAGVCPTGAITLRKNGTPRPVKTDLCIGCGACQKVCPAEKKAMIVYAVEKQHNLQEML